MRVGAVGSRYVGNAAYNVYNKKACSNIHAHWSVAFAQLVVRLSTSLSPLRLASHGVSLAMCADSQCADSHCASRSA